MSLTPLEELGEPFYFIVGNAEDAGFGTPPNPLGQSLRTWVRSLGGQQKEAVVVNAATGMTWRFACDEGAHLGGYDKAPNPLTYLCTGLVASYMNEITALAEQRGIELKDLELILDNFYWREGDFRKGTMVSGSFPPELLAICEAEADDQTLNALLYEGVAAAPLNGLALGSHPSLFNLVHNGKQITTTEVTPLGTEPYPDPGDSFSKITRMENSPAADGLITFLNDSHPRYAEFMAQRSKDPELTHDHQLIHMNSSCMMRPDGIKDIIKKQGGSTAAPEWSYLSEEAKGYGGQGRAPDAASLISAGIGLCFMTQIGRYSHMAKLPVGDYSIVQDTHFSLGGASGGTGKAAVAKPVETHIYLESECTDDQVQEIVGVAERTCFLHAFCRDDLKPKVRASRRSKAA